MGPPGHFIIATAPTLQQNNEINSRCWGPFGALRGRGALVLELKVTLDRYATDCEVSSSTDEVARLAPFVYWG